ncbi:MAG: ABC-type transport auxiliary lipoprotein family protein [Alphaproteobacteria bacterium]
MKRTSADGARRRFLGLLAAAPLVPLAGCQALNAGQGPAPDLFRLTPKADFAADLPKVSWQLLVESPVAPGGLNTTRIALLHSPTHLEYYAGSDWIDRPPAMVQTLIIQSFENSDRIVAVGRDALDLRADYVLRCDIRDFQTEYFHGGRPVAHVSLNAKLVALPRRTIVASASFEHSAEAGADRIVDLIAAFNESLGHVLGELVAWTLKSGEADRTAS